MRLHVIGPGILTLLVVGGLLCNFNSAQGMSRILASSLPLHTVATIRLPGCNHDHGLLLDAVRRLAFVACDGNARLLVVDMHTFRVLSAQSVGPDPDVLAFDTGLRRLYVAAESGVVSVFGEQGRSLVKLGQGSAAQGAHTIAVDSRTHRVVLPLEGTHNHPVLRIMAPQRVH
jgi:DNA-binding beta-propeller fold protein YncE